VSGYVTRFAPSPTGYLHLGHAYSAVTAFEAAQNAGGRFLLRIEDIDTMRCKPEFEAAIHEDLAWLGLEWESPVRRQSEHMDDYQAALEMLRTKGLLYRCFRTRREILDEIGRAPHEAGEVFRSGPLSADEEETRLAAGEPFAWRLWLDAAMDDDIFFDDTRAGRVKAQPELLGDVVLGRKDVGVAYHLAVVVDDALQGVTEVVRGEDLFEATHIQRLLQHVLDLPTPTYRHHKLIAGPDGKRYAKRDQAATLRSLRVTGVSPDAIMASFRTP